VFLALYIVHIPLTTFTFLGGALAVGVGFGAQNILNNFISGFIIMSEKPVKVGDVVEVEGEVGTIEDIGARCTRILTGANIHKLIPNSMLLEKTVTNWTHANDNIRIPVPIGIAYESDTKQAADVMLTAVKQCPGVLSKPEPFVLFRSHGASTLNFEVYFWAKVANETERMQYESKVNFLLNENLRNANIEIAFPQLDVHLGVSDSSFSISRK
jgi:small-conductance mechanosensitive channel